MGYIVDLSHHQDPKRIDYDTFAKHLDWAIIRTQYGSNTIDRHYKTHHAELRKRGVPTAAYAWVRGVSIADMQKEAEDFYNRTLEAVEPSFWFLDVEEKSMDDMRAGVSAYVAKLRELGAKKIGIYIAHHLYKTFDLNLDEVDAVWIPRYGANNGKPDVKPDYPCDIWQYTSVGRVPGYDGDLDLNMVISDKDLTWFTGEKVEAKPQPKPQPQPQKQPKQTTKTYKVVTTLPGYKTAADAKNRRNKAGTVKPGTYHVFNESQGMVNVTRESRVPGSWINPADNKKSGGSTNTAKYYIVQPGDSMWKIAQKYKMTLNALLKLNPQVKGPNYIIYPKQKIRVK
jgi:GH25 family lysozyme M1 (1,4-beta-N-acetylmuramidase)/LysM repeat protein